MNSLSWYTHFPKHEISATKTVTIMLLAFLLLIALGSCSTTTYYVGGKSFTSREEAEATHSELMKNTLSMVQPIKTPVGGNALIVIPTLEKLESSGIRMTSGERSSLSDGVVQYLCHLAMRENETFANCVKLRNIFDKVELIKSGNPKDEQISGHDFLIYLYNPDPSTYSWYIEGRDWSNPKIIISSGNDFLQKTLSKLDNIEKLISNKP